MKPDKICIALVSAGILLTFLTVPAWAGSPQQHRWEGVAIGIGAVVVGSAILHSLNHPGYQPQPVYHRPSPPRSPYHRGSWQKQRVWVEPTYKKIWNPGHYNRRGRWVRGHWIRIENRPGYWKEQRVWISRR